MYNDVSWLMHYSAHYIGCYLSRKCFFIIISHEIKFEVLYNFRLILMSILNSLFPLGDPGV